MLVVLGKGMLRVAQWFGAEWCGGSGDGLTIEEFVPRQALLPIWRQLSLPVHLLCLATLLGCVSPVAGDVELEDDGVVHHPVDGCGGGHEVGKDALSLGENRVRGYTQGRSFVAFAYESEEDFRFLGPLGQVAQVIQEQASAPHSDPDLKFTYEALAIGPTGPQL